MIHAVLFDVGGTLHEVRHSGALETQFCAQALERLERAGILLPVPAEELAPALRRNAAEYKKWSEESLRELPAPRIWNEFYLREFHVGEERLAPVAEDLSWMYDAVRVENVPRPRLRETMRALREMGLTLGVISNIISASFVPRLLEDYGIAGEMSCVVLSSVEGVRKPDAAIFRRAAERCGVPCGEMAYVGDTLSRDVRGCRNAGVALSIQIENPSLAAREDAYARAGVAPDALIHGLAEIPELIRAYNAQ